MASPQSKLNPWQRPVRSEPTDNPKHEAFAQCLARGMTQEDAYVGAGYSPKSARSGSTSLLRLNPWIKDRVKEIQASERQCLERVRPDLVPLPTYMALEALAISKQRILEELWDNAMKSKGATPYLMPDPDTGEKVERYNVNMPASNAALIAIGKELGMFVDGGKNQPEAMEVYDVTNMTDEQLDAIERIIEGEP